MGTPLILIAEPDNLHDEEAIAVYMDYTRHVGYIKHESCQEVKPLLNSDGQCNAVVLGNDGHATFYIEIPNAPEVVVSPICAKRKLPEWPLPQGIKLAYTDEEQALQVVAPRLMLCLSKADALQTVVIIKNGRDERKLSDTPHVWARLRDTWDLRGDYGGCGQATSLW